MSDVGFAADQTIDCIGLSCPMPIVRTKKAMENVPPGHVLEVLATDPGSVADVKHWSSRTGHDFLGTTKEKDIFKHYIRRADPSEVQPEKRHPHVASNDELAAKLKSDRPVILDVREPMEYAFGHIPGAKLVPLGNLEQEMDKLSDHVEKEVYVVCRTGSRSDTACQILTENGFTNVKNVLPGMSEWSGPIEKSGGATS